MALTTTRRHRAVAAGFAALAALGLAACSPPGQEDSDVKGTTPPVWTSAEPPADFEAHGGGHAEEAEGEGAALTGDFKDNSGKDVGTVTFTEVDGGVKAAVEVTGLTPGSHPWHVHQTPTCDGDFTSAGDHLKDGATDIGDAFPALYVAKNGEGELTTVADKFTWDELTNDGKGRAIVIHDGDKRVACAVVAEGH